MMYNDWGWNHMNGGVNIFCVLMYMVILIDLVLVGVWLYKQINKK